MTIISVLLARSIRLLKVIGPPGGLYMLDAVKLLKDKYGFLQVPTTLAEFKNEGGGVSFKHGKYTIDEGAKTRDIVIDDFVVYSNAIVVETKSTTDDSDLILDDITAFAADALNMKAVPGQAIEKMYISNVEVLLNEDFNKFFPRFDVVSTAVHGCLSKYGTNVPPFESLGLAMFFDQTKLLKSLLANFRIERREGESFEKSIFFSSAPLKTADHFAVLEMLDRPAK